MHVLFLGLLNDATYMLKKQITGTAKTKVTVPVTASKKEDTKKSIVSDTITRTEKLSQKSLAGFGESVYPPEHLRTIDISNLTINTELINRTVRFEFIPEQYLLNNTAYNIEYSIFK